MQSLSNFTVKNPACYFFQCSPIILCHDFFSICRLPNGSLHSALDTKQINKVYIVKSARVRLLCVHMTVGAAWEVRFLKVLNKLLPSYETLCSFQVRSRSDDDFFCPQSLSSASRQSIIPTATARATIPLVTSATPPSKWRALQNPKPPE